MTEIDKTLLRYVVPAAAVIAVFLGADEARYLLHGYALTMTVEAPFGRSGPTVSHIGFPLWLGLVHGAIYLGIFVILALAALFRREAFFLSWATFLVAVTVGMLDVYQYGTIGSPTSLGTVLLVLLLASFTTYWRRTGLLR